MAEDLTEIGVRARRDADLLAGLAAHLSAAVAGLGVVADEIDRDARVVLADAAWLGAGAEEAGAAQRRRSTGARGVATDLAPVPGALRDAAELCRRTSRIDMVIGYAEQHGHALDTVPNLGVPGSLLLAGVGRLAHRELASAVGAALDEADRVAARALRSAAEWLRSRCAPDPLTAELSLLTPSAGAQLIGSGVLVPDLRGTAAIVRDLRWAATQGDAAMVSDVVLSLRAAQSTALVHDAPDVVGSTDGVPPALRYAANRLLIERAVASASGPQRERLQALLVGERHFLFFDPSGAGRVAEVFGDLGRARHVAVMVPGIGNSLDDYDTHFGPRCRAVQGAAVELDPGTATVAWLGYDTPGVLDAPIPAAADGAAEPLARAADGLAVTAPGAAVTVVGHSYGTLVAGRALQRGMRPAAVVVAGSPGMGANSLGGLRGDVSDRPLPPVYAERAPLDPVGLSENFGRDPADSRFGAVRLATGLRGGGGAVGHSDYFDPQWESSRNIARVVTGHTDALSTVSPSAETRVGQRASDIYHRLAGLPGPHDRPDPFPWSVQDRLHDPDLATDLDGDRREIERERSPDPSPAG